MLTLPAFDDLSADEDDVLALPLNASALIVGPPGTGKTLMAVQRANLLHRARRPTMLLMYGRLLSSYTNAVVKSLGIGSIVLTYHKWFEGFWRRTYGSAPPKAGDWAYDWAECKRIIIERPPSLKDQQHVIVDEGQDLPRDFYLILRLISRTITVFADENQRITDQQSTLDDIRAATGISIQLSLRRNQRNPRPVAEFANHFYTGLPSGRAELPAPRPTDQMPILDSHPRTFDTVEYLAAHENANPEQSIGVLLPRATDVRVFHNRLRQRTRNETQLYVNSSHARPDDPKIDMATPGIKVLTWASCKGLEFHAVFLPELQAVNMNGDDLYMKLYVACTRTRGSLALLYTGEGEPAIVKCLPLALLQDRRL